MKRVSERPVAHIGRRQWVAAALLLGSLLLVGPAWAGSYLDRVALLITQATQEADYLRAHLSDRELARTVHKLAAARLKAAATMQIPKEVAVAHPHLLLVLENYERAADAAEAGQTTRFLDYLQRARDEETILRGVLQQLGWPLPRLRP
jgi:hypothetical protein